jgi:hypothetical protein
MKPKQENGGMLRISENRESSNFKVNGSNPSGATNVSKG